MSKQQVYNRKIYKKLGIMKKFILTLVVIPQFIFAQINFQWAGSFAGNSGANSTNDLVINNNGHVFCTGSFIAKTDFDPSQSIADTFFLNGSTSIYNSNIFVTRLNKIGKHVWTKEIKGSAQNVGKSIAIDKVGNLYITGYYSGATDFDPSSGVSNLINTGCFVLKLDSTGSFVWVKEFKGAFSGSVSGNSIEVDKSGNIIIGGHFTNTVDFDPGVAVVNLVNTDGFGFNDGFVAKLDDNGNFLWVKHIASSKEDAVQSNICDNANNIYSFGIFSGTVDFNTGVGTETISTNGQKDIFIIKHDSAGNYLWVKTIGGVAEETSGAITLDINQNIYIAGGYSNKVDFNPSMASTDTLYLTATDQKDCFVLKLNNTGTFMFAKSFGNGIGVAEAKDIAVDKFENIYTYGQFANNCDFDPSIGVTSLVADGGNDMFVCKLSNLGNYSSAFRVGGSNYADNAKAMKLDTLGNIYVCGSFFQVVDFNPTIATYTLNSLGYDDGFVAKYGQTGFVGLNELRADADLVSFYPNPTSGIVHINLKESISSNIIISDIVGQEVFTKTISSKNETIDLSHLGRGIYFISIIAENKIYSSKFIKE